ncbi:MAG: delta-60 repeat domain-containing protein, partial [Chthoniobacterales bacterium]
MALVGLALVGGAAAVRGQSALDGFDPNANGVVRVVVVQPDGKILIGGDFTTLSPNGGVTVTRNGIARLNPDGALDTAFNPNANNVVFSIAVQTDGKILAGGLFHGANSIGGQTRNYIARLDATTGLADSFDPNANGAVYSIAVQAD